MQRRSFIVLLASFPGWARAQAAVAARLAVLTELLEAVKAAGEAIGSLTDGFRTLVVAGADSYDYVSAARERSRLVELGRNTAQLLGNQNYMVVESISSYLSDPDKTEAKWRPIVANFEKTLVSVNTLLADVKQEKGDFVLEPAYVKLQEMLNGRVTLLTRLKAMDAPTTAEEIALLKEINARYMTLVASTRKALAELNAYLKDQKK